VMQEGVGVPGIMKRLVSTFPEEELYKGLDDFAPSVSKRLAHFQFLDSVCKFEIENLERKLKGKHPGSKEKRKRREENLARLKKKRALLRDAICELLDYRDGATGVADYYPN